jgi:hypothetical protein
LRAEINQTTAQTEEHGGKRRGGHGNGGEHEIPSQMPMTLSDLHDSAMTEA